MQRLVVPDGECHVRAKIAEITNLLYHTACSVGKWAPVSAAGQAPVNMTVILNPTMGVKARCVFVAFCSLSSFNYAFADMLCHSS